MPRQIIWIAISVLVALGACSKRSASEVEIAPDTDIFLVDTRQDGDLIILGDPVNVTDRPGYDNQPSFLPDGSGFLYSAITDRQADTYR